MKVSKDCCHKKPVLRRSKRSKISLLERENSLPIPLDLIIEIFLRLPVKSIALCRCVSKLWNHTLGLPCFTEFFLTRSLACPYLLFISTSNRELRFFSTPQQHLDDESLSPVMNHLMHVPYNGHSLQIRGPIRGLVYISYKPCHPEKEKIVQKICNPSTGQVITLPNVKSRRKLDLKGMFGYDPIDKQHKVLFMTSIHKNPRGGLFEEHQVLTLGTEKRMSWKMIECGLPHFSVSYDKEICINGVLYYEATDISSRKDVIACFDVRSEKFNFMIKPMETTNGQSHIWTLENYNGKLGLVSVKDSFFQLWVLEDFEKQEWSKHTHILPPMPKCVGCSLRLVGVTSTNEIVFFRGHTCDGPFQVFYYNIERETLARVGIVDDVLMKNYHRGPLRISLDHVEDVTFMKVF